MSYKNKEDFYAYCINRWRKRKEMAVDYKGGKCVRCGYDKHPAALQFHHTNPEEKSANWGKLKSKSWKKITEEIDKCILLCANCHAIEHSVSKYD
jgi:hypothetical protein